MKIQCNVCESAEARVLCCADEAALCWSCDDKVHAANKLASKHQRVPLSASSSPMPKCDICQETVGYFFCLEDRALLCRKCDISIHTANAYVSAHQRFLLTGVKVGLESINPAASASSGKSPSVQKVVTGVKVGIEPINSAASSSPHSVQKVVTGVKVGLGPINPAASSSPHSVQKVVKPESPPISKRTAPVSSNALCSDVLPVQTSGVEDFEPSSLPLVGGSTAGIIPQWQFDEFLGMGDFNQNYGYMDYGSSKADSGKIGESDSSQILRDAEVEGDECFSEVPETCWAVPQIPSPPTASGLHWPKTLQNPFDCAVFESDVNYSPLQSFQHQQSNGSDFKRRRAF